MRMTKAEAESYMEALWRDPHLRNDWIFESAKQLSKTGDLPCGKCMEWLAENLCEGEIIDIYYQFRNYSMRSEDEWRKQFLSKFRKKISESDLPQPIADWLLTDIDPSTGLGTRSDTPRSE